jgi:hypothetical protein
MNGTIPRKKSQPKTIKKTEPNFMKLYKQGVYYETDYKKGHETQTALKRLLREFGLQQYLRVSIKYKNLEIL